MPVRDWAEEALEKLQRGHTVEVRPTGHSMRGRINSGDLVTLAPCSGESIAPGDAVLARVCPKRHSLLVLHLVLACSPGRVLIGNNHGRVDGWVALENVFGRVIEVRHAAETAGVPQKQCEEA